MAPAKPPIEISVEGKINGKPVTISVRGAAEHAALLTDSMIRLSREFDRPAPDESPESGDIDATA